MALNAHAIRYRQSGKCFVIGGEGLFIHNTFDIGM